MFSIFKYVIALNACAAGVPSAAIAIKSVCAGVQASIGLCGSAGLPNGIIIINSVVIAMAICLFAVAVYSVERVEFGVDVGSYSETLREVLVYVVGVTGSGFMGFMFVDFIVSDIVYAFMIPACEANVAAIFGLDFETLIVDMANTPTGEGVGVAELVEDELCKVVADEFTNRLADNELQARLGADIERFL